MKKSFKGGLWKKTIKKFKNFWKTSKCFRNWVRISFRIRFGSILFDFSNFDWEPLSKSGLWFWKSEKVLKTNLLKALSGSINGPLFKFAQFSRWLWKIFIRVQNFGKFRFGVRRGETEFGELFYGAKFWADFTRQKSETFKVIPVPSHKFSPPNTWSPQLFIKISRSLEKYTWVIIWFIVSHIQSNYNKLFMV